MVPELVPENFCVQTTKRMCTQMSQTSFKCIMNDGIGLCFGLRSTLTLALATCDLDAF